MGAFVALWMVSLALLAIGTYGWLGQEPDPLAGIFVILLGSPWVQLAAKTGLSGPLVAILSPAITLMMLMGFCRIFVRRG